MKYGYARVSTDDQNTALQLAALKRAGCTAIFTDEGLSGATVKRPALTRCLTALRPGDTLIVWKLDRLGSDFR
jgi:Enterobacteriaceae phage serine recombinase